MQKQKLLTVTQLRDERLQLKETIVNLETALDLEETKVRNLKEQKAKLSPCPSLAAGSLGGSY